MSLAIYGSIQSSHYVPHTKQPTHLIFYAKNLSSVCLIISILFIQQNSLYIEPSAVNALHIYPYL